MSHPDELPDDPSELVRIACDDTQPLERRELALAKLRPVIERTAWQVAATLGVSCQDARDLADKSFGGVGPKLGKFDGRKFFPWLRRVLRNLLMDQLRGKKKEPPAGGGDGIPDDFLLPADPSRRQARDRARRDPTLEALERAIDRRDPFSAEDLQRLGFLDVQDRVVLLVIAGLWPKVPAGEWNCWVDVFGQEPPFPPVEFLHLEEPAARVRYLAPLLDMRPNTLQQQWCRNKEKLTNLKYIQDLLTS
jgi:DNA-directed RNA polymerase specialized sigma24 family protein